MAETFAPMLKPDFTDFTRYAAAGRPVPVWREFLFDRDTAVSAYAKLMRPPFGFLLESLVGGEKWARYSFVGTRPRSAWRLEHGGRVSTWDPTTGWSEATVMTDPLADLDRRLKERDPVDVPGLPRFFSGAVGYLGYDVVRYIEDLQSAPPDTLGIPEAILLFTDVVLAIDNVFGRAQAITTVDTVDADEAELRRRYDAAAERVTDILRTLDEAPAPGSLALGEADLDATFTSSCSRAEYERDVQRIRDYITAGDAFQVVLSQRLSMPLTAKPLDLYRALRSLNPSPYLFFLELDGISLVGSSPEVLVRAEQGVITVRPIAGTRPRGRTPEEDDALAAELIADEKERAEHLMLVDLGRNDVGRVAEFGSVRIPAFMGVERYSHVLHIVSQVEGDLRPDTSAMDVFRACFPAGTVSGAPKIRAMEILDELEPVRRGIYAGAVGYFADGGRNMDTAIAIRTLVAVDGVAHVQAGAGIVADSNPAAEYEETLAKARALLRVVQMVGDGN
ncbi:MAG: anthranilate synthase component I [Longimicrobiales bacterium]